jgi:hypothetical protein
MCDRAVDQGAIASPLFNLTLRLIEIWIEKCLRFPNLYVNFFKLYPVWRKINNDKIWKNRVKLCYVAVFTQRGSKIPSPG